MTETVPPRAAVIGTGRSGTGYIAAVLKAAGIDAGHEAHWHAHGGPRASQLDVDVSWLALPDIESGLWSGPVLHVVRHPVDTVRSLLGTGFFSHDMIGNPYTMHARLNAQSVGVKEFDAGAAVQFWCEWNARCAAVADLTIQLETTQYTGTMDPFPTAVEKILGAAVPGLTSSDVSDAMKTVPRDTNTRGPAPEVDPLKVWNVIGRRAHAFGYGA